MALKSNPPIEIIIIGDTHALDFNKIPIEMLSAIRNADIVIHVGDYTSKSVLRGLVRLKGKTFKGVFGNADPLSIRREVPNKDIIEVLNNKILNRKIFFHFRPYKGCKMRFSRFLVCLCFF